MPKDSPRKQAKKGSQEKQVIKTEAGWLSKLLAANQEGCIHHVKVFSKPFKD